MDNVEVLVKVARELKKNERAGTVGTVAAKSALAGAGLLTASDALSRKAMTGKYLSLKGSPNAALAGALVGGGLGATYGGLRAASRKLRGLSSVSSSDLKKADKK